MAQSRTLTDKVILDLKDISVANGFDTDVSVVDRRVVTFQSATVPHIEVRAGGSGPLVDSDPEQLSVDLGAATHRNLLKLYIRDDKPEEKLDDLIDDVRNAIERKTSNIQTVAQVWDATVVQATPFHTTEDLKDNWAGAELLIETRYEYERGLL